MLVASTSDFDRERSSAAVFGNEVDIDQHLMMCIVDTVKMMLAVSSLELQQERKVGRSTTNIIWRRANE